MRNRNNKLQAIDAWLIRHRGYIVSIPLAVILLGTLIMWLNTEISIFAFIGLFIAVIGLLTMTVINVVEEIDRK